MSASPTLVNELLQQLQGAPLQQMAQNLGESQAQTQAAVQAAVPMLLGALGNNAQSGEGANALFEALQRDHAGAADLTGLLGAVLGSGAGGEQSAGIAGLGGLAGMLGSALGGGAGNAAPSAPALDGTAILGHIFGSQQERATSNLGQATGLGDNAGKLLQVLAPIVMAFLAQRASSGGMNASDLGSALGQEQSHVQQQGGVGGDLLSALLDQNGDGKLDMGDLLKMGGSLLGGRR